MQIRRTKTATTPFLTTSINVIDNTFLCWQGDFFLYVTQEALYMCYLLSSLIPEILDKSLSRQTTLDKLLRDNFSGVERLCQRRGSLRVTEGDTRYVKQSAD